MHIKAYNALYFKQNNRKNHFKPKFNLYEKRLKLFVREEESINN